MNISEQPLDINRDSQGLVGKDSLAIFAIISLALGLLALPLYIVGLMMFLFFALMFPLPWPLINLIVPILICVAGVLTGLTGLRSKRRVAAIIGILLSGLFLVLESWAFVRLVIDNWK